MKLAESFPAVLITGARQVGKTSLLQRTFPNYNFVSLDLPSAAGLAERNPADFIKEYPPPVIIDEVQYAPELFRFLKIWIDENRDQKGQFLLSGSQKFSMMKNVSESLAGRIGILELETLSTQELKELNLSDTALMIKGGFPEIYKTLNLNKDDYFRSYISTYLERDVRSLLRIGQLRDFERFLRACAYRSGQILNKSDLARDIGISAPTANEWLSVLVASNQIVLLEPWFQNQTKCLVKSPKIYMNDVGLLCHMLGIETDEMLLKSPALGAVWETLVFAELRKAQVAKKGHWELYFWRDLRGLEVDFLIHHGGRFELIDAKASQNPNNKDAKNLFKLSKELDEEFVTSKKLIARVPNRYLLESGLEITNLSACL